MEEVQIHRVDLAAQVVVEEDMQQWEISLQVLVKGQAEGLEVQVIFIPLVQARILLLDREQGQGRFLEISSFYLF